MNAGHPAEQVGVLVMAHGTPDTPEGIADFYTRIRRGRPPSAEQLAELRRRYEAIGGTSPLTARTRAQVEGLRRRLESEAPARYTVALGSKHVAPFVEDAALELAERGVSSVIGLVLTPHGSSMGSGEYLQRAEQALAARPGSPPFTAVVSWYRNERFVQLEADLLRATIEGLPGERMETPGVGARERQPRRPRPMVVFTAHSLPRRVVEAGDRYPEQLAESAGLVAAAASVDDWTLAWQSAGRTPEPWLDPDLLQTLRSLPDRGFGATVVCPLGFVADHLEVLYDLDVEARAVADQVGLVFARTPSLNDNPRFVAALAEVVRDADRQSDCRSDRRTAAGGAGGG